MSQEDLDRLRRCARPVMFDTGNAQAPFAIKGSSFFVGFRNTMFVVTARHVVGSFEPHKLLFYPTNDAKHPVRITRWWRVEDSASDSDSSDLFLARADFQHLPRRVRTDARLVHLDPPSAVGWFDDRIESLFFLCGFPSDRNEADYQAAVANIGQVLLHGRYTGPGTASGTHQLRIENPLGVDFDGLSGSPVYSLHTEFGASTSSLRFCGMAIRGSARSSLVYFLEADVILLALQDAVETSASAR